jgi:TolB-like protein/DNA-binding winged helix-turn-helix (wHTH) protein
MPVSSAQEIIRFGIFQFEKQAPRLLRNGAVVRLGQQPLQVLAALLNRPGQILSREELRRQLWSSDVFVDFDHGLNKSIQKLRDALGDSASTPLYIETLPRVGYRFIAPLEELPQPRSASSQPVHQPSPMALPPPTRNQRLARWPIFILSSALLVLATAFWFFRSGRATEQPIHSLAVLPFENLTGDPSQDYFVEGMTDELTTTLARIPGLTVISRNSAAQAGYRSSSPSPSMQQLARLLNVDAVVEGSVVRSEGTVRINAQLVDARSDRHIWAQSFQTSESDPLDIQSNVASLVAHAARLASAPKTAEKVDGAAYDAYLRGRYFFNKQDSAHSIESFERAIALQPGYASAYAGLADALDLATTQLIAPPAELMPRARAAARKAVQLDPDNGEAYTALGSIQTIYDWNFPEAEKNLLRGIALSPNYPLAEMKYAVLLDALGRTGEAVTHMRRALDLDPLSFFLTRRLGATLFYDRQYPQALEQLRAAQQMEPAYQVSVDYYVSLIDEAQHNYDQAVVHDLSTIRIQWPAIDTSSLESTYRRGGWIAYSRARQQALLSRARGDCVSYDLAVGAVSLGDKDQAIRFLHRAVDERCYRVIWSGVDPLLDPLHNDPRFTALLQRILSSRRPEDPSTL